MAVKSIRLLTAALFVGAVLSVPLTAQVRGAAQGITLDFVDADVRAVVQALAPYLDRPVVFGQMGGARISLQSPRPVPPSDVLGLLRATLALQNLDLLEEGTTYVVRARAPATPSPSPSPARAGTGATQLFSIRLRHARAADVAATVNALYGRASALGELGARRLSTLASELRDNRIPPGGETMASASAPQAPAPAVGATGGFSGEVTIVPDARTNTLLVRASRADFELIQAAVGEVDVRPLQVIIQVTIAEVRRNSDFSYALSAAVGAQAIPGRGDLTVGGRSGVDQDDVRSDLEILARNIGGVNLDLTLRAGVARGAVSISSRPVIFAANNEPAEILIGSQRPFVQLRRSGEAGIVDQVIQYKDVGTRLAVLPTISGDGYVQLQVTQEINNATREVSQGAPVISTRTVQTSLLVRDGHTAILGGLAEAIRERGSSGIPLLSDIPVLGGIFGSKSRGNSDTELFIFLTPRVVRDDEQLESTVEDVRTNARGAGRLSREPGLVLPSRKREATRGKPPVPAEPEKPPTGAGPRAPR